MTKIEGQSSSKRLARGLSFALIELIIFMLASFQVFREVQAAQPGSPLYPVKVLSEKILNKRNENKTPTPTNKSKETGTPGKEDSSEKLENNESSIFPILEIKIGSGDDEEVEGAHDEGGEDQKNSEGTPQPQSTETHEED
ncbi:hypothetical protein HY045_01570 [Candidatus Woesebacteria bacterium]|nr:hypothetical protein [Candidatus Woesebacteria bacterium]